MQLSESLILNNSIVVPIISFFFSLFYLAQYRDEAEEKNHRSVGANPSDIRAIHRSLSLFSSA
jgi:hypothetical protein